MLKKGDLLDNTYRIIEQIGSGGGGIIYKAEHIRLQKEVAVKLIRDNIKDKINERAEADILKKLKHTYLPQVYDFLTIGGDIYTIMDFIPGKSFEDELKEGKTFTQKEIIKWTEELCEALKYLHEQNPPIIHSDIKPGNIMHTPVNHICLIDFNISLLFYENDNVALGKSDGYSPPEQYVNNNGNSIAINENFIKTESLNQVDETLFLDEAEIIDETELLNSNDSIVLPKINNQSKPKVDERSDIYSLGATLYHLLTGTRPNKSTEKIKQLEEFNINISDGLKCIINKAMEYNPENRFKSVSNMLDAVKNINKLDKRYKNQIVKQRIALLIFLTSLTLFSFITYSGYKLMGEEKSDKYYKIIDESASLLESGKYEEAKLKAYSAMMLFENKIDSYYINALSLFIEAKYDECIEYINNISDIAYSLKSQSDKIKRADLDFIMANSLFYTEQYTAAIKHFEMAISKNEDNSEYYRDYAISLARDGKTDSAQAALTKAIEEGLDDSGIMVIQGELSLMNKDYENAEKSFNNVLKDTADVNLRERVYITLAKIYRESAGNFPNSIDKEISILEEASNNLPIDKNIVVTEMLGEAFVRKAQQNKQDSGVYYSNAVKCFTELLNRGYGRFYIMNNLAIIYQSMGEYNKSEDMLLTMKEKYSDDYRVYMQLAFLYADMQQLVSNENRNYSYAYENYLIALEYYSRNVKNNETDLQMNMLKGMMEDIKARGWIN